MYMYVYTCTFRVVTVGPIILPTVLSSMYMCVSSTHRDQVPVRQMISTTGCLGLGCSLLQKIPQSLPKELHMHTRAGGPMHYVDLCFLSLNGTKPCFLAFVLFFIPSYMYVHVHLVLFSCLLYMYMYMYVHIYTFTCHFA